VRPDAFALLGLALALGMDSCRSTLGLGMLRPRLDASLRLAASFAIVEAVAIAIGSWLGGVLEPLAGAWASLAGPLMLAATGIYVIVAAGRDQERQLMTAPAFVVGLPLGLSLDNLLGGTALGMIGVDLLPGAIFVGLVSGLLAFAGLKMGAVLSGVLPRRSEVVGGLLMLAAAFTFFVGQ
jgi:putative Mn2+ efflux pump MntP